jgi:hypothetical protein
VVNDVRAAERLLQRVVDWEKNFAEGDSEKVGELEFPSQLKLRYMINN